MLQRTRLLLRLQHQNFTGISIVALSAKSHAPATEGVSQISTASATGDATKETNTSVNLRLLSFGVKIADEIPLS